MRKTLVGKSSAKKSQTFVIDRPPVPQEVNISGGLGEITLSWTWVDEFTQTEIFVADSDNFSQSQRLAKVNAHMYSHTVGARQVRYYWLRHGARDKMLDHSIKKRGYVVKVRSILMKNCAY
ncbi:Uncharacterised protein [[Pasteurella] mairii]|uniref:Uncharacterized protein n=1 Tax=[Pasteurella] mairii TaxID=757 RepID=A0A379B024_9PAST|nr:Uncharacterised protein [[Pasteurella] mairii]